jgi:uncharacterized protein (DUF58 family)
MTKRRYQFGLPGVAYLTLAILAGLGAMVTDNNLLVWVFGIMLAMLIVSGLFSGVMLMSLRIRRIDPRNGAVGEPMVVRYAVSNASRFLPALNLRIEEGSPAIRKRSEAAIEDRVRKAWTRFMQAASAWVMHVGPRETVHGEAVFWPTRRGEAHFDRLTVSTSFPFGIIRKSITTSQPQHTLIFPRLYQLKPGVLNSVSPAGPMGTRISNRAGAGVDFFGLREFRPGDSLKHIAWKRAVGLDTLISIERAQPSPPKMLVTLNLTQSHEQLATQVASGIDLGELEEQAISLAASFVHAASHAGLEVGLCVLGFDLPVLPIRRSHWHIAKIKNVLASIDLKDERINSPVPRIAELERAGKIVIHPGRIDTSVGGRNAWHFSARQRHEIAPDPIGWVEDGEEARRQEAQRGPSEGTKARSDVAVAARRVPA